MAVVPELQGLSSDGDFNGTDVRRLSEAKDDVAKIFEVKAVRANPDLAPLAFSWKVVEYQPTHMEIAVVFDKPTEVSSYEESDYLEITFKSEVLFYDKHGQSLSSGTMIKKKIPQQYGSEAEKAAIEATGKSFSSGTQVVFASNFFLNFGMSASMQYLWDMINASQLVIILPLMDVKIPKKVEAIFKAIFQIASFDVVPTDLFYGPIVEVAYPP